MDKTRFILYTLAVELDRKIREKTARVGVIGLGYVGLPLAVAFARRGFRVTGIEVDVRRAASLRKGRSYIEDVPSKELAALIKNGALSIDAGSVEMRWTHDEDRLSLTWFERDEPLVVPPTHRGFGTRLIERVFAAELKAKVALEYPPEGLICRIDARLAAAC